MAGGWAAGLGLSVFSAEGWQEMKPVWLPESTAEGRSPKAAPQGVGCQAPLSDSMATAAPPEVTQTGCEGGRCRGSTPPMTVQPGDLMEGGKGLRQEDVTPRG